MNDTRERVQLLSVSLLEHCRDIVQEMRDTSETLGLGLGWHYLLDLCWAATELRSTRELLVLDAGAGLGVMQWWLADQGATVLSVDRRTRERLPHSYRTLYHVQGLRQKDLSPISPLVALRSFLPSRYPRLWREYPAKLRSAVKALPIRADSCGRGVVFIYNQDLRSLPEVASSSVDAVVSISALEHNRPDDLRACVPELMRVLKPGGKLVATLAGAKDEDWYHEPSKGWCYTEATLREIFQLPDDCPSNYDRYDELFAALVDCAELRDNLADFYFRSGDNGMPWGVWDPKYHPVGVVKVKPLV
jgi:SAM-dependent methyltransferase